MSGDTQIAEQRHLQPRPQRVAVQCDDLRHRQRPQEVPRVTIPSDTTSLENGLRVAELADVRPGREMCALCTKDERTDVGKVAHGSERLDKRVTHPQVHHVEFRGPGQHDLGHPVLTELHPDHLVDFVHVLEHTHFISRRYEWRSGMPQRDAGHGHLHGADRVRLRELRHPGHRVASKQCTVIMVGRKSVNRIHETRRQCRGLPILRRGVQRDDRCKGRGNASESIDIGCGCGYRLIGSSRPRQPAHGMNLRAVSHPITRGTAREGREMHYRGSWAGLALVVDPQIFPSAAGEAIHTKVCIRAGEREGFSVILEPKVEIHTLFPRRQGGEHRRPTDRTGFK